MCCVLDLDSMLLSFSSVAAVPTREFSRIPGGGDRDAKLSCDFAWKWHWNFSGVIDPLKCEFAFSFALSLALRE